MTDEQAFLDALRANPADDTTRLVYADWLDERGESAKAEYLRLVVKVAPEVPPWGAAGPGLSELAERGQDLPDEWREAAGGCFELVLGVVPYDRAHHARRILRTQVPRTDQIELAQLMQAAPAVLFDRLPPESAVSAASDLTEQVIAMQGRYTAAIWEAEEVREQFRRGTPPWFMPRWMGRADTPAPARFDIVLSGHFDWRSPQTHQNPDLVAGPIESLFGLAPGDATPLLYTGTPIALNSRLAFTTAASLTTRHRKALKLHPMSRVLSEVIRIELIPGHVIGDAAP